MTKKKTISGITDGRWEVPAPLKGVKGLRKFPSRNRPVVYFLCLKGEVVYVGISHRLNQRIKEHALNKLFDSVFYLAITKFEQRDLERHYINNLNPLFNEFHKKARRRLKLAQSLHRQI